MKRPQFVYVSFGSAIEQRIGMVKARLNNGKNVNKLTGFWNT
jgi:hypothetical protein